MDILAVFNPDGTPFGFYAEEIHGPRFVNGEPNPHCIIPADVTEITEDQWNEFLENQGRRRWDGSAVVPYDPPPPPAVVPFEITMRQAKLMLLRSGMLEQANEIIAAMEGEAGEEARIEWNFSAVLERAHPLVTALGAALGLPAEQIDSLFIWASVL